jgi:thioredoxin 1
MAHIPVSFELYVSSFCGACARTREVLHLAQSVLPGSTTREHDVAFESELAEANEIDSTPTVIVRGADGSEVFRAAGVPTIDHVLRAAALAVERAN